MTDQKDNSELSKMGYNSKEIASILQKMARADEEIYELNVEILSEGIVEISTCYTGLKRFEEWSREYSKRLKESLPSDIEESDTIQTSNTFTTYYKLPKSSNRLVRITLRESEILE